jgi:hypothetical protein
MWDLAASRRLSLPSLAGTAEGRPSPTLKGLGSLGSSERWAENGRMRFAESAIRRHHGLMSLVQGRSLLCAAVLTLTTGAVWGQDPNPSVRTNLTADQIVDQIERHNQSQSEALKHYETVRHYQVEYRGFGSTLAAKMEVEVRFDAAAGLSYRILSQSGSKILCDKVLRRALDSEKEASRDKAATALTPANYRFRLEKVENLDQRPEYVLDVEPLTGNKFLYRGKIWVDATDFAVKKIEAEPAKNPSFWISRTQIRYTSAKVGGFWLPERNRSETKVRIGGTAVLTIDYGTYQVVPSTARQSREERSGPNLAIRLAEAVFGG